MLIPSLSGALKRVKREAYFQHIYHTAAIEGNTLTLAQIRMILETGLSVEGNFFVFINLYFLETFLRTLFELEK